MALTLADGISIHAAVLVRKRGKKAAEEARTRAESYRKRGDGAGYDVWMRVAVIAESLALDTSSDDPRSR